MDVSRGWGVYPLWNRKIAVFFLLCKDFVQLLVRQVYNKHHNVVNYKCKKVTTAVPSMTLCGFS